MGASSREQSGIAMPQPRRALSPPAESLFASSSSLHVEHVPNPHRARSISSNNNIKRSRPSIASQLDGYSSPFTALESSSHLKSLRIGNERNRPPMSDNHLLLDRYVNTVDSRTYDGDDSRSRNSRSMSKSSNASRRRPKQRSIAPGDETASESGMSVLSTFPLLNRESRVTNGSEKESSKLKRQTDSLLRRGFRWICKSGSPARACYIALAMSVFLKWSVSLGPYSGQANPPMRGDFEAQRHWIALTSSWLDSSLLHATTGSSLSVGPQKWYYHDLNYWGLDYPPLTAYHSLVLGGLARLSAKSVSFVSLRPISLGTDAELQLWERNMQDLESKGEMKVWMRYTVLGSDLIFYTSAVFAYCIANYGKQSGSKKYQAIAVTALTILLQPSLVLIDHGHFQYNCVMLGFVIWAVNLFQSGHDLMGAAAFVCSLGFKQMALYYSPAVFAYLLGKCIIMGGRKGFSHLLSIGTITILSFVVVFLPFLNSVSTTLQALHRIFPFARGLFEDKVANAWCVLNLVVKLRQVASVPVLAGLALVATLLAILPFVLWMLWVSYEVGKNSRETDTSQTAKKRGETKEIVEEYDYDRPRTLILLPHALFLSSMAFFLFSFQVHEKSILLPLMPITLLMGGREVGHGRMDWEWGVLLNNVGAFSMWPLLKRDKLETQYFVTVLLWNYVIGYNPLSLRPSFNKVLSMITYSSIFLLHMVEMIATPPPHLPDLFVVLNLTLSAAIFGLGFLWASKRFIQEAWVLTAP